MLHGLPHATDHAAQHADGLANLDGDRATADSMPSVLTRTLPGVEAGYSPMTGAF